jgi:UTP--glucose-1-phosphate uridylyltransferase
MKVKTAVIPIAGKGTRFLPATKQIPKEMIPIVDKPMVHYVVEEAVEAGIEQIVFVTSTGKEQIENYFDRNCELESFLLQNGKEELYEKIKSIGQMTEVITVRQKEQLGLGHAIACAAPIVGHDPFAVLLGDDIVLSEKPVIKQLCEVHENYQSGTVIGVMEVDRKETDKYGIISGSVLDGDPKTYTMDSMVEKPKPSEAPTCLATPGRYILNPDIFQALSEIPKGAGGEYQLTDAINLLAKDGGVYAHIFDGDRFDAGNIPGYLRATVEFALRSSEFRSDMEKIIVEKFSEIRKS